MRCKLIEYHGDNWATFQCHKGHVFSTALIPKRKGDKRKPLGEQAMRSIAHWWRNGVYMECSQCNKEHDNDTR